jgi:hypothetical protein
MKVMREANRIAALPIRVLIVLVLTSPFIVAVAYSSGLALFPTVVAAGLLAVAFISGAIERPSQAIGFALIVDFGMALILLFFDLPDQRVRAATARDYLPVGVALALGLIAEVELTRLNQPPQISGASPRDRARPWTIARLQQASDLKSAVALVSFLASATAWLIPSVGAGGRFHVELAPYLAAVTAAVEGIGSLLFILLLTALSFAGGMFIGQGILRNQLPTVFGQFRDALTAWLKARAHLLVAYVLGYAAVIIVFFGVYVAAYRLDPIDSFRQLDQSGALVRIDVEAGREAPFAELVYFSMNSIAPLGYSEFRPFSAVMRFVAFSEMTLGIGWTVVVFAALAAEPRATRSPPEQIDGQALGLEVLRM